MYHEEEIIDGVLCHRGTPDGDWVPYTLEALTIALTAERRENENHLTGRCKAVAKLEALRSLLDSG